jgi:hypothetical protein
MQILRQFFKIPSAFIDGITKEQQISPLGYGYFLHRDKTGAPSRLDIFYQYAWNITSGECYVLRQYNFALKSLTYICINYSKDHLPIVRNFSYYHFPLLRHIWEWRHVSGVLLEHFPSGTYLKSTATCIYSQIWSQRT